MRSTRSVNAGPGTRDAAHTGRRVCDTQFPLSLVLPGSEDGPNPSRLSSVMRGRRTVTIAKDEPRRHVRRTSEKYSGRFGVGVGVGSAARDGARRTEQAEGENGASQNEWAKQGTSGIVPPILQALSPTCWTRLESERIDDGQATAHVELGALARPATDVEPGLRRQRRRDGDSLAGDACGLCGS
jgi:hypothetical protein